MPALALITRPHPTTSTDSTFAALRTRNFRLFVLGQLFSNPGSWMQRIAQDWLVLSLTGSATAVGVTTALQFVPVLLIGLPAGVLADRYPKRTILRATQVGFASGAAALAVLTLTHLIAPWHVYVLAFLIGVVTAVDNPARQAFVNEMVGPDQLRNAIGINASVFQLGGLVGPAVGGLLIGAVGPGYAFLINAVSYAAPYLALSAMRDDELSTAERPAPGRGQLRAGLRYSWQTPQVFWATLLVGVFGVFTANLPVTLAAYAKSVQHSGPGGYGLLNATVAVGSVVGALFSARRLDPRLRTLVTAGGLLAGLYLLAAAAPDRLAITAALLAIGATTLALLTAANATVQLAADDQNRGRVLGLYLLVFIGGAAAGGPLLGTVDQHVGPRAGLLLAGVVPALATLAIGAVLARRSRAGYASSRGELRQAPAGAARGRRIALAGRRRCAGAARPVGVTRTPGAGAGRRRAARPGR